jgi:hypothetical protein
MNETVDPITKSTSFNFDGTGSKFKKSGWKALMLKVK